LPSYISQKQAKKMAGGSEDAKVQRGTLGRSDGQSGRRTRIYLTMPAIIPISIVTSSLKMTPLPPLFGRPLQITASEREPLPKLLVGVVSLLGSNVRRQSSSI
jgi:hypothetical protein